MKLDITKSNRWKLPKVSYTNFRKEFPNMGSGCFRAWFSFSRYWGGKLWNISVRHHVIELDFRVCPWSDLMFPDATKRDRDAVKEANKYL